MKQHVTGTNACAELCSELTIGIEVDAHNFGSVLEFVSQPRYLWPHVFATDAPEIDAKFDEHQLILPNYVL